MLGDNMYGGQSPDDFVKKFEQPYAPLLAAGVKFQASLGNHDRPENVSYKNFNMNGQRYYTFARNNVRFFALDSTQMDQKQVEWLDGALGDAREDWKICYFHHPLYSNADRHGASVDLRVLLEPIFVRRGVNVVFSGHDHVYERIKPQKGIYYFVSGSAGQLRKGNMRPNPAETAAFFDQDQSFMLVEIAGDEMYFETISRTGKTVDSGTIQRQAKTSQNSPTGLQAAARALGRWAPGGPTCPMRALVTSGGAGGEAPFPRLSQFAFEHLALLPLGAGIALVWANLWPESYFRFSYAAAFVVNDIALAFFFALMTKEVVEATAPGGVLHPWRRALLPVIAAIGVAAIAAQLHMRIAEQFDEPMLSTGWPITFATDVAFGYFIARLIFRPHHPAIPFLILLGIASDALGFVAVALFNPTRDLHLGVGAILLLVAMTHCERPAARAKVRSFWPYLLAAGSLSWFALYWSGLHPALALVPVMPFLPHAARDPGLLRRCQAGRQGHAEPVRGVLALPGAGGAVLLRAGQRGRAVRRVGGGDLGAAAGRADWQAARAPAGGGPGRRRRACTCRIGWDGRI